MLPGGIVWPLVERRWAGSLLNHLGTEAPETDKWAERHSRLLSVSLAQKNEGPQRPDNSTVITGEQTLSVEQVLGEALLPRC